MINRVTITFDAQMPAAAVEVSGEDLLSGGRVWISPGESKEFETPAGTWFPRVFLPSGRVVTLPSSSEGQRTISPVDIQDPQQSRYGASPSESPTESPTRQAVRKYIAQPNLTERSRSIPPIMKAPSAGLAGLESARLVVRGRATPITGTPAGDGKEFIFECTGRENPMEFIAETPVGDLHVQVPGSAVTVWARVDRVAADEDELYFTVRIATRDAEADALTEYLYLGDIRSAESMTTWVESAQELLLHKGANPYAATIGAYLLLRLRKFEEMHDWAGNLARYFPELPDGAVIWARQLILQHGSKREAEIKENLRLAVARGLPVFREGLVLLGESLSMIGPEGDPLSKDIAAKLGRGILDSPFTAGVTGRERSTGQRVNFDIGVAARA